MTAYVALPLNRGFLDFRTMVATFALSSRQTCWPHDPQQRMAVDVFQGKINQVCFGELGTDGPFTPFVRG
jgi:hypothetical protein